MNKKYISFFLLFIIVGAFGGYLYQQHYNKLLKSTSKGLSLGKIYGKMVYQSSCMMGLKLKYAQCDNIECELSANGYIVGCMKTAKADQFCTKIPNAKEYDESLSWVIETCNKNNLNGSKCQKYMHKFISVCTEQTDKRKRTSLETFQDGFNRGLEKSKT